MQLSLSLKISNGFVLGKIVWTYLEQGALAKDIQWFHAYKMLKHGFKQWNHFCAYKKPVVFTLAESEISLQTMVSRRRESVVSGVQMFKDLKQQNH